VFGVVKRRDPDMVSVKGPMTVFIDFVHEMTGFLSDPALTRRDLFTFWVGKQRFQASKSVKMVSKRDVCLRTPF
jgi:hypothetical protein